MSPPRALSPEQIAEAAALYERGQSCRTLAPLYHVHPTTMARWLRNAGVKLRTPHYPVRYLESEDILKTTQLAAMGISQREIGRILGIHQTTVAARLRRYARP